MSPERQGEIAAAVLDSNPDLLEEWNKGGQQRAVRDVELMQMRAEDRTVGEIAAVLGITTQSVRRAIRRLEGA